MSRFPGRCLFCGGEVSVKRVSCLKCGASIEGTFTGCPFCRLSEENLKLIEIFVKNRGNMKKTQEELGVSYPVLRRMLEEAIAEMEAPQQPRPRPDKREVVRKLVEEEITPQEAIQMLEASEGDR